MECCIFSKSFRRLEGRAASEAPYREEKQWQICMLQSAAGEVEHTSTTPPAIDAESRQLSGGHILFSSQGDLTQTADPATVPYSSKDLAADEAAVTTPNVASLTCLCDLLQGTACIMGAL